jgi:uncharacterized repeat protein (TIGR01451 family)
MLTADLEIKRIPNVGAAWQTVALENTYTDAIVVCTYNLPSAASPSVTTRIQNVTATSFQLRIQQFENSAVVTAADVHCVISDEGAYDVGGLKYEARKVVSDGTSGLSIGWGVATTEDVTADVTQTYALPVTLGQVMSFNDVNASVFWNFDCDSRGNRAFFSGMADGICVGKHIGQINGTRASETLGYFVVETGGATVNDIAFLAAVGPDIGAGVGNSPPYNYAVTGNFDTGILTQGGEDGGQGGWAILYGTDPLPTNQIRWAIEEETVAGDTSRTHTTENVAYWVFDNNQSADLAAQKGVNIFTGSVSPYALPGTDVIYSLQVENTGSGPVDADTLVLIDALPPEITFYNGDIDDGGPETDAVAFVDNNSGLTFDATTDLAFSNAATKPANFAACNYTPASGYDANITYICLAPKGALREGVITASDFTLNFRAAIK